MKCLLLAWFILIVASLQINLLFLFFQLLISCILVESSVPIPDHVLTTMTCLFISAFPSCHPLAIGMIYHFNCILLWLYCIYHFKTADYIIYIHIESCWKIPNKERLEPLCGWFNQSVCIERLPFGYLWDYSCLMRWPPFWCEPIFRPLASGLWPRSLPTMYPHYLAVLMQRAG